MTRTFQRVQRELQEGNGAFLINHSQAQSVCPPNRNPLWSLQTPTLGHCSTQLSVARVPSGAVVESNPTSLWETPQGHRVSVTGEGCWLSRAALSQAPHCRAPATGVGCPRPQTPTAGKAHSTPRAKGVSVVHRGWGPATVTTSLLCAQGVCLKKMK